MHLRQALRNASLAVAVAAAAGLAAPTQTWADGNESPGTSRDAATVGSGDWRKHLPSRSGTAGSDWRRHLPSRQHQKGDGDEMTETAEGKARASASASATASAGAKAGAGSGECVAHSESSAEARSGDRVVRDFDRDRQATKGDGCAAEASSEASATTGGEPRDTD